MHTYKLNLSKDELTLVLMACRELAYKFNKSESPDLWEQANVIDDIMGQIYEQQEEEEEES